MVVIKQTKVELIKTMEGVLSVQLIKTLEELAQLKIRT